MSKKKKEQNPTKIVIIGVLMICLVVGYYFHISNKTEDKREEKKAISETQEVLLRNIATDYPPSPKEVIKYYASISKCFYDGNYSEEELSELAKRSRDLFDDELLATQTDDEYLECLKASIKDYAEKGIKISSFSTSSSVDVEYRTTSEGEMASLYCLYNLRQGSLLRTSNHEFVLRRDAEGHWKILGWKLAEVKND